MARLKWNEVLIPKSAANAPIKNTASPEAKDGWYPAFSATGQDVWLPDYKFEGSGIVVSAVGAHCGKSFKAEGKWNVVANTHALMVNEEIATRDYCWYILNNEEWWIRAGAGQPFVKLKDSLIREHDFPPICEQNKITYILDCVSTLIDARKQQVLKLDELVKSRFIELFGDPVLNPMGWQVSELSNYITFLTSGSRGWAKYFSNDGEYFITIKNVKNCRITLDDVQHIIPPDNAEAKRTRVQEGDLLISITADLGRTGVVSKEIAAYGGYINQHLTCIRLDQSKIRPLYAAYFLESDAGKNQFQAKNQNGVKAGLNFNAINSLKLLVPPVEVQDAFISFVEQTDKLKFEVKEALEKLETLKKSLMQQYFG